jgi:hypothetical protein
MLYRVNYRLFAMSEAGNRRAAAGIQVALAVTIDYIRPIAANRHP